MAGQVHRASGGRSARRAADPEMAERRRAGGWETNTGGGRNASGRKCFAAFGERLSSLRVRPVDPSVASKAAKHFRPEAFLPPPVFVSHPPARRRSAIS